MKIVTETEINISDLVRDDNCLRLGKDGPILMFIRTEQIGTSGAAHLMEHVLLALQAYETGHE